MSSIKPSTLAMVEDSKSAEKKDVDGPSVKFSEDLKSEEKKDVGSPSERFNALDIPDLHSKSNSQTLVPLQMLSNESLIFNNEPVVVEVKENRAKEYTGFTIACKDESTLKLKRQESLRALKPLLAVPKQAEDAKGDDCEEVIEMFSNASVGNETHLAPNPYSKPQEVWTGLEITVKKKDQIDRYVLMSHGLAKWVVEEKVNHGLSALKSTDSELTLWEIDTAVIVRDKEKGPYVKLSIDKQNAVYFYPVKASDGELKRFMTESIVVSPSANSSLIDFNS